MVELTQVEVVERLRRRVVERGSQAAVAAEAGVSGQLVSDVLAGRRDVGPRLLSMLGIQRLVRFVVVGEASR